MKSSLYLETSIISYLAARPSRNVVTVAKQIQTWQWWEERRADYELFVSEVTRTEIGDGDPKYAERRLALVSAMPVLSVTKEVEQLMNDIMARLHLPANAVADAYHMALSLANGMDYLLTWNCRHIANAVFRARLESFAKEIGLVAPNICTPEMLMEREP